MTRAKQYEINNSFDNYLYETLKDDLAKANKQDKKRFYSAGQVYDVTYATQVINFLENNKYKK